MKTKFLFFLTVCLMAVSSAIAQTRTIKGRVIGEADGEPLIGAAIVEKGSTSNGVVADINGNFSITIDRNSTLVVSYIGFTTQQVKPAANNIVIKLKEDAALLDDIVVIGYGVQKKSDLTGAIASVKADDIKNLSTTDAAAALQGKVSGVQIINSGAPGEGADIRVRGYSSNGDNVGPQLIVDGLKVDNIQYLDPSNIESIEILKDGASAAIYGVAGGNGVVLITTKSGKSNNGAPHITYSFKAANQSMGKKADLFDAPTYIDYQKYLGNMNDDWLNQYGYKGTNTDWYDEAFENSWSTQHSLTMQGGNDNGHFLTSINYVNNDGIVRGKKDVYQRMTAQINADYKLTNWFSVSTNNSIEKWNTKGVTKGYNSVLNSVVSIDPITPAYYDDINDCNSLMASQYNDYNNWVNGGMEGPAVTPVSVAPDGRFYGTSKFIEDATGNPLFQINRRNQERKGFTLRGVAAANLTPIDGLTITSRLGYRIYQSNFHNYEEPYWLNTMVKSNTYTIRAEGNNGFYYQWENFANYNKTFGKHNVGLMAGMSFDKRNDDNVQAESSGTDILKDYAPNYLHISNVLSSAAKNISNVPEFRANLAYFGRISYSYDNRYYAQLNIRKDASDLSKLSKQARWGTFPSFSLGWNLGNEKFIKEAISEDVLSFLKIRGSWGRNGNLNNLSNYAYQQAIIKNDRFYQMNPSAGNGELVLGSKTDRISNPDLKWETSEQLDLGVDARFFNDRLTFALDYFNKNTKDLIFDDNLIPEVGGTSLVVNSGEILNRGVEVELGWRDRIGHDFKYNVSANFSWLKNEVRAVSSAVTRSTKVPIDGFNNKLVTAFEKGYPLWYFYGYKYAGVNSTTGKAQYYKLNGEITEAPKEDDRQYVGAGIPKFTYGVTINLEYKGFDFTLFGTGAAGNKIYNLMVSADRNRINGINTYWLDSWKQPGDASKYPDMKAVSTDWTFFSSSAAVFNGSYFKFKQIQLGYTIPVQITKKALISNFRIFGSLDDFFTITSYPGADPETASMNSTFARGVDNGTYPTSKKIVFGASLTF